MSRTPLVLALVLLLPAIAGCFAEDAPAAAADAVAASAQEAGAVDGPAPAAAKSPYQVGAEGAAATAYPVEFVTTAAKAPYVEEFTGTYQPQQCLPTGGGLPLGGLGLAQGQKVFDVSEAFAAQDVFSFELEARYANTDDSWAELHLFHVFDQASSYWNEPTSQTRGEVVMNFSGQGFITQEEFFAIVAIECWYGQITSPIAFTISLTVTFAEGAIPSAQPVLLEVPEDATRLFVSGLALDAGLPVTSHYRVFGPDDELVCECALNSNEAVDTLELPGPGAYVVLVDHTEGGFVALALDAPPAGPLRALASRFEAFPLPGGDGGAVDETVQLQLPSTPLEMWAWVLAPGDITGTPDAGFGQNLRISVANGRGEVLRIAMVGYVTFHAAAPGMFATNDWYAVPLEGDWEFYVDHHAYDLGEHTVTLQADQMRGQGVLFGRFYDRG